jgi:hypothetical protein
MLIIPGLIFALAVLYFWLQAHWFARVVAFLLFAGTFGFFGALLTGMGARPEHNNGWLGLLLGVALAWPVSGIPIYCRRHQARSGEQRRQAAVNLALYNLNPGRLR